MQCSVTVVNLIHDTATEIDRPVCHVIPGCSWREKLDTSTGYIVTDGSGSCKMQMQLRLVYYQPKL